MGYAEGYRDEATDKVLRMGGFGITCFCYLLPLRGIIWAADAVREGNGQGDAAVVVRFCYRKEWFY